MIAEEIEAQGHRANKWWGQNSSDGLGLGPFTYCCIMNISRTSWFKSRFILYMSLQVKNLCMPQLVSSPVVHVGLAEDPFPRCRFDSQVFLLLHVASHPPRPLRAPWASSQHGGVD